MTQKFLTIPCSTCGAPRKRVNGAWLREQREKAGLSLRDMGKKIGLSAAYLCDIEWNRRNCPEKALKVYEISSAPTSRGKSGSK